MIHLPDLILWSARLVFDENFQIANELTERLSKNGVE